MINTAHVNILESSDVTLTSGAEDSTYPLYRLYDRNTGRPFRTTAATTTAVKIDQGASGNLEADTLIIPDGHNLDGMTLDIEHSDDDATYTPAVTQWSGTEGLIIKSWSPITHRYWRFTITSPASIPSIAELFLTSSYQWPRDPSRPSGGPLERAFNVTHRRSASGGDRFLVHGPGRIIRRYNLPRVSEAHKEAMLALNESWYGSKPFWLMDHTGQWVFGRLASPMDISEVASGGYALTFEFEEALP